MIDFKYPSMNSHRSFQIIVVQITFNGFTRQTKEREKYASFDSIDVNNIDMISNELFSNNLHSRTKTRKKNGRFDGLDNRKECEVYFEVHASDALQWIEKERERDQLNWFKTWFSWCYWVSNQINWKYILSAIFMFQMCMMKEYTWWTGSGLKNSLFLSIKLFTCI